MGSRRLEAIAQGQRAAAIAEEFVVSVATVRTQIKSIPREPDVSSQLDAAALLHEHLAPGRPRP